MHEKLDSLEAYIIMFIFLNGLYDENPSNDFAVLLGAMQPLEEMTADPERWEDWLDAVHQEVAVSAKTNEKILTPLQAYNAMKRYIAAYLGDTNSKELKIVLDSLSVDDTTLQQSSLWAEWLSSISRIVTALQTSDQ